jgi:pantetheine-phosphate adenylyltransferase
MQVCLGGTFNIFHKGHRHLLDKAFETAGKDGFVFIGLSDGYLTSQKKFVTPYTRRSNAIKDYIIGKGFTTKWSISPITTKYGLAIDQDFDAIIVSPETRTNAVEINDKRESLGKKPLRIMEITYILADDNKPISSTRIYNDEIDVEGKIVRKR